jgi:hypothetical protein
VCCDATASSIGAKVRGEVVAHFHAVAVKVTVVCGIGCLDCQDVFLLNNPLDAKENDGHTLAFSPSLVSPLFDFGDFEFSIQTRLYGSCFLPRKLV